MCFKFSVATIFILVVFLSLTCTGVHGNVMCYACTTLDGSSGCADPMDSDKVNMVTCPNNYPVCVKYDYEMYALKSNVTVRMCGPDSDYCTEMNTTLTTEVSRLIDCMTCDKDHCNSAVTFGVPLVSIIVAVLATKFM